MSHSEQDKKDGLSIEGWRRDNFYRRNNEPDYGKAVVKQAGQEVTETRTTLVETTIDPIVLKKIHNLEEELLNVKKKIREQRSDKRSTSGSSESDSEDSDDQKTTETTKSSKPTKPTISTTVTLATFPTTTSTIISTTANQKTNTMTESSSESSSTETEENQDSTNATTIESTISEVKPKTLTSEKKPPATPTTSFTTGTIDPHIINTTLIDINREKKSYVGKKEDSSMQVRPQHQGIIPIRERARDENPKDTKKYFNDTTVVTTEMSQGVVTFKNDVFEVKFNIKHDGTFEFTKIEPTVATPKPLDIVPKSNNDAILKVKNSTKYFKQVSDVPDIVDVIGVLNSTMSTQDKLKKLQSLRRKIDLMSDDDPNGIS